MTVATSFIALAALLAAAPPSHRVQYEYRQDARQEARQDVREKRDDVRDVREASNLLARFETARSRRDMRELHVIDAQLRELIAAELDESRRELRDERRDVREERRDMRGGVHEAVPVAYDGHGRVRRDEVRDVARERRELAELRRIARELDPLYGRFDRQSLKRKHVALRDLVALANHEVRQDRREIREDRRQHR